MLDDSEVASICISPISISPILAQAVEWCGAAEREDCFREKLSDAKRGQKAAAITLLHALKSNAPTTKTIGTNRFRMTYSVENSKPALVTLMNDDLNVTVFGRGEWI